MFLPPPPSPPPFSRPPSLTPPFLPSLQLGWDTDQFLTDPSTATRVMLSVLRNGGLAPGGINFDAKLRRESTDTTDLFIAHVQG